MTLRIAHLSDIHFGDENMEALKAATQWLRGARCDLLVISGDLTRWGEAREFEAAAEWLQGVPGPKLITPGNHDAPYLDWGQRLFTPFARFEASIGPAPAQSYAAPGLAVCGINTARGAQPRLNWSKGWISPAQVAAAASRLQTAPHGDLRVVVCHHPLMEMPDGPISGRVWGGVAALRSLTEAGVDLVLSGHVHAPFALAAPFGDAKTYVAGASTLSHRERGALPGFNLVEAGPEVVRVAALGWNGDHFASQYTWELVRRVAA